ncbi:LOW QUALITY PROTEIN: hypothetical protein PanWU01x14_364240 [Parasponia andersonii]|uniref:Uncharacterized protein n=1 Tax=Parasponia andersonii TaxID=3476 RepID=A0A2P5A6D3_PARAD|nr:LOW QUALITY PROTEIN: hypothetical protein PanWU01x14_364240 [Parasponia andersonii]
MLTIYDNTFSVLLKEFFLIVNTEIDSYEDETNHVKACSLKDKIPKVIRNLEKVSIQDDHQGLLRDSKRRFGIETENYLIGKAMNAENRLFDERRIILENFFKHS